MRILIKTILLMASLFHSPAFAEFKYNMSPGVTPISHDVYSLHMLTFWICVGIAVIVFSVMFYSLIMHRKSRGHKAADFHEHLGIEIMWAVIPFIILVIMAVPASLVLMRMEDTGDADITIKVTGYQWRWKYEYLDQGISFFSTLSTPQSQLQGKEYPGVNYLLEVDNPLILPIHKKVRFLVTANDVIHSWWVPDLGVKKDAIPGFINSSWASIEKTGTYRGQCAELCGAGHGFMPIVVVAKTEAEFGQWVEQQTGKKMAQATTVSKTMTKEDLMRQGEESYNKNCSLCHKQDGTGMPPTFPAMKGSPVVKGPVEAHINIVLKGKTGTAMQAFGPQLSDEDIASVITYERNAWGNNTGSIVQPTDIKKARN